MFSKYDIKLKNNSFEKLVNFVNFNNHYIYTHTNI